MLKRQTALLAALWMLCTFLPLGVSAEAAVTAEYDSQAGALKISATGVSTAISGDVFVAGYDAEDRLTSVSSKPISIASDGEQMVEIDFPAAGDYTAYVWDDDLKPITDPVAISGITERNAAEGKLAKVISNSSPDNLRGALSYLTDGQESETEYWAQVEGGGAAACAYIDLVTPVQVNKVRVHVPQAVVDMYADDDSSGNLTVMLGNTRLLNDPDTVMVQGTIIKAEAGWHELECNAEGRYRFVRISGFTGKAVGVSEVEVYTATPEQPTYSIAQQASASIDEGAAGSGMPQDAIDGNPDTAWSSSQGSYSRFMIDLGKGYNVAQIIVKSAAGADPNGRHYLCLFDENKTELTNYGDCTDLNSSDGILYSIYESTPVRYVGFRADASGTCSLAEVEIISYDAPPAPAELYNVALGASAQLVEGGAGTGALTNLFDGSEATSWMSEGGRYARVDIDLGAAFTLEQLKLISPAGTPANRYYIGLQDEDKADIPVTPQITDFCSTQWRTFDIPEGIKPVRYIVVMTDSGNQIGFSEIQALSYEQPEQPEEPTMYNVALGADISLHDFANTASGALEDIIDGNEETGWLSMGGDSAGITIDLGAAYTLEQIRVKNPEGMENRYYMGIQNEAKEEIAVSPQMTDMGSTQWRTYDIPEGTEKVRYIWLSSDGGNAVGFTEVQALSYEQPAAPAELNKITPTEYRMTQGATLTGDPANLFDGQTETGWVTQGTYTRLVVDLGAEYNLEKIRFNFPESEDSKDFFIYVVESMEAESVLKDFYPKAAAGWMDVALTGWDQPIRYLWIAASAGIDFREVEFLTYDEIQEPAEPTLYNVALGATVTPQENAVAQAGTLSNITDGEESTDCTLLSGTGVGYVKFSIDLGAQYDVKQIRVKAPSGNASGYAIQLFAGTDVYSTPDYRGHILGSFEDGWVTFNLPEDAQSDYVAGKLQSFMVMSINGDGLGTFSEIEVLSEQPKA